MPNIVYVAIAGVEVNRMSLLLRTLCQTKREGLLIRYCTYTQNVEQTYK